MSFRGSLKTLSLSDIFQNLAMNAQTGMLRLVRKPGGQVRMVFFESGEVRNTARGPVKGPPPLLTYLVGRCLLTDEQAGEVAEHLAGTEATLTGLVAELGVAPAEETARLVWRFNEEEVYDIFTWEDADFEFTDGPAPAGVFTGDAPGAKVRLSTGSLVMEAARRIDEWSRIRQALPSGREILLADEAAREAAAELEPVTRRVLLLADGSRDIDDLVADSHLSGYEVGGLLGSLLESGKVRSAGAEELERAAEGLAREGQSARVLKICERLIALGQDTPAIRARLADAAVKAEDPERAAIHLGVLADRALEQGRAEHAAEIWRKILDLLPRNVRAHQGLAEFYVGKGRKEEALKHYTALVKAHAAAKTHDRAIAAARTALELAPQEPRLRTLLADTLIGAGHHKEAADEFEQLADALAADGNARGACDALRRALHVEPNREETRRRLTQMLNTEESRRRGRKRLVSVLLFLLALGLAAGALAYHELVRIKPVEDQAWRAAAEKVAVAEKKADDGNFDEAIRAYEDACAEYNRVRSLWSLLGGPARAASARSSCLLRIDALKDKKREIEGGIAKNSAKIRRAAEELLAQGDLEGARAKYLQLRRYGDGADQDEARRALEEIAQNLAEIDATVAKSGGYPNDQEEFEAVQKLVRKYPRHPKVQALTFPVRVESDPPGAEVRLNDGPPALTPCTLRPSVAGPNRLGFSRKGYRPAALATGLAEAGAARTVRLTLSRVPAWSVRIGAPVQAPLVLLPERAQLIFGDREGTVWCLSALDGKPVWKRTLGPLSGVTAAATVDGEVAYLGSFDGRLYALNLADGRDKDGWAAPKTDGLIRSAARVARVQLLNNQAFIFFGADDRVCCADAAGGQLRWKSEKLGTITGSVLVTPQVVYAASDDEHLHALSVTDGKELWKHKLGAALRSSPLLAGDIAYLGADDNCLYALDVARREVRWRSPARGAVRSGPVLAGARLYFATMDGDLCAAEPTATKPGPLWQVGLGAAATAAPLVTESRVYLGTHDGVLHALDRANGREAWSYRTGAPVHSAAVFFGGQAIFGSDDGFIYAFDER